MAPAGDPGRRRDPAVLAGLFDLSQHGPHGRGEPGPCPSPLYPRRERPPSGCHPDARRPAGPPVAIVGTDPTTGLSLTAACSTCHTTRPPDPTHGFENLPEAFHQGLTFNHGNGTLSCLSCHNPDNYDTLRAANDDTITYPNVMALCAQCHSKQHTDYQHGAHGGMNGYWDLSQGPRTRHSCIDCHDPHAPAYPMMRPTFKPIDRGLDPHDAPHESDGQATTHQGDGHE